MKLFYYPDTEDFFNQVVQRYVTLHDKHESGFIFYWRRKLEEIILVN